MVVLSSEANRLLGSAVLDPGLGRALLSSNRAAAIRDYGLTAVERTAVLNSRAVTLAELAGDLCNRAGYEARTSAIDHDARELAHDLDIQPISPQALQHVVQRVITSLPGAQHNRAAARQPATSNYRVR